MTCRSVSISLLVVSLAGSVLSCSSKKDSTDAGMHVPDDASAMAVDASVPDAAEDELDGSSEVDASTTPDASSGTSLECTVPATPPSAGSCVTVVAADPSEAGAQCNPVTNGSCATGEQCDVSSNSSGALIGFICYPPPNTATLCGACDDSNGPFCSGGLTCMATSSTSSACAKYCCSDADCGAGKCVVADEQGNSYFGAVAPNLGICKMTM